MLNDGKGDSAVFRAAAMLREALQFKRAIAALTGAGVSAESGVPTFRGQGGLWQGFRAEDLATPQAFARHPETVWEWYHWRRDLVTGVKPNAAHRALAALEKAHPSFTLVTQNVDRLHQRAGSRRVLELHGNLYEARCTGCQRVSPLEGLRRDDGLVACDQCDGLCRPHIVWFGETLPQDVWERAYAAATAAVLFLVLGTSAAVYPAAGLIDVVQAQGGRVVEMNPEATAVSHHADVVLRYPAGEVLPRVFHLAGVGGITHREQTKKDDGAGTGNGSD